MKTIAFLSVVAALSAQAHADKARGGGQIIDVDTNPALADLVTKSVCDWKSGPEMVASTPEFESRVIKSLKNLNWYFGASVVNEARHLRYCFTGALYTVPAMDWESPVKPPQDPKLRQVAYRSGDSVYIDSDLFNKSTVSDYTRAFTLLHEVMHSYLPMDIPERQIKLRSFDKAVSEVESGQINDAGVLNTKIRNNDIQFPTVYTKLKPYQRAIEYLLSSPDEQASTILKLTEINSVLDVTDKVYNQLSEVDQYYFDENPPKRILESAFKKALVDSSLPDFQSVLTDQRFDRINPMRMAIETFDDFSSDRKALISSPAVQGQLYATLFSGIANAALKYREEDGQAAFAYETNEEIQSSCWLRTPIMHLEVPKVLPESFRAFANVLTYEIRENRMDIVKTVIGDGSQLSAVLGLTPLHAVVTSFHFNYGAESYAADRKVELISENLRALFRGYFKSTLTPEQFNQFKTVYPQL